MVSVLSDANHCTRPQTVPADYYKPMLVILITVVGLKHRPQAVAVATSSRLLDTLVCPSRRNIGKHVPLGGNGSVGIAMHAWVVRHAALDRTRAHRRS